jgi:hypothetical protein
MKRQLKRLGLTAGIGALITVLLLATQTLLEPLGSVTQVVFWPATLLLKAAGTGPRLGTAEPPRYEWTPVHDIAIAVGIGLSWVFYSGVAGCLLALRARARRRASLVQNT